MLQRDRGERAIRSGEIELALPVCSGRAHGAARRQRTEARFGREVRETRGIEIDVAVFDLGAVSGELNAAIGVGESALCRFDPRGAIAPTSLQLPTRGIRNKDGPGHRAAKFPFRLTDE